MAERVRAVIIGGGIVGVSVLYHLAKAGWREVLLLERSELTAGSTWHAAAGFHAINGDPNVARLQAYTIDLYKEVEDLSGQSCGLHMTGGLTVAASDPRWEWLRAEWARQQMIGLRSRLVEPEEVVELCPIMSPQGVRGGIFDPHEGHLDPNGTTHAFAAAAKAMGAEVRLRTAVTALEPTAAGGWRVITDQGEIEADHVVNAAGLWASRVGEMAGLSLPIVPMEHMYIVTEPLPELEGIARELPMTADLDANIYLRQEQRSVLLGVYEGDPRHWHVEGVPWDFGMELIAPNLERITEPLMEGFQRFPCLLDAGIRRVVNGGMVFSPDGNPLVGPAPGLSNYWCACGSMAGFSQNGAIGLTLAQWMIEGEPRGDVQAMDVARFGDHVTRQYLLAKTRENYARRLKLAYPNEQLPAGRPLKTTPLYDLQKTQNAVFGVSYGQEYPLFFAPAGQPAEEEPTFRRSSAFPTVGEECRALRRGAGLLDSSSFAKYRISGAGAERWIARMLACRIPTVGRIRLAPMLSPRGRLIGDLTVFRPREDEFWLFGSGPLQAWHMRWFLSAAEPDVAVENVTDAYGGFAISGPRAPEIVSEVLGQSLEVQRFPLFAARMTHMGSAPVLLGRLSLTGETGYELYTPNQHQRSLYASLRAAGDGRGLRQIGIYALNSLRLEEAHGIWFREFTPDYTPVMSGLDRFVDYSRSGFIGRDPALIDRERPPQRRLVALEVEAADADASGFEPIWSGERLVGYTTSGGFGHTTGRSVAMGYIDRDFAEPGQSLHIHIIGDRRPARVTRVLGARTAETVPN